jgi:hypothetical protein
MSKLTWSCLSSVGLGMASTLEGRSIDSSCHGKARQARFGGLWGLEGRGVHAGSSLVGPESAQQRSALAGRPVPDNGL